MNSEDKNEKNKKAGHPIFILMIFIVLIGFVFYVPDIYKKYNKEISDFLGIGGEEHNVKPSENQPTISPQSAFYQLGSNSTFKFNEIEVSKVSLSSDKQLSLTISTNDAFDLSTSGYYIEFFRNKETFLGRRSLLGKVTRTLPIVLDVSNLDLDTTTYYVITHTSDSSIIDNYKPSSDESGITTFTCQYGDTSYDYDFYLRKLTKVSKKISYTNDNLEEYSKELLKYQKLEKEYNEYRGVTASIVDNTSTLIFLTEFDYGEISNFSRINDSHLYEKGAMDYLIKFKMEAEGYDCR